MATANQLLLREMLEGLWAVIDGSAEISALGIGGTFKLYDGTILPVEQESGLIPATSLPALYCQGFAPSTVVDENQTPHHQVIEIRAEIGFIYANGAPHAGHSSLDCLGALMTLADVISTRVNYEGAMAGVDELEVAFEESVEPVVAEDGSNKILYWDGRMTVTLRRNRPIPSA